MISTSAVDTRPAYSPHAVHMLQPLHTGVAALVDHAAPAGNAHDRASREVLLRKVAALAGLPMLPAVDARQAATSRIVLIPGDAIDSTVAAAAGIVEAGDILGGVVPAMFVGTKAITHPLVDDTADRPASWSMAMAAMMGDAALTGYTAFSHADAARAGRLLLATGPVRIKDVCAKAGLGQVVVHDAAQLDAVLAEEDAATLAECGIVLEENLIDVVTYSVGSVTLGDRTISYWGSQNLTRDHRGREVYGGSDLCAVQGDFDALAGLDLPPGLRRAIDCAATFDRAAHIAYPDMILTRRNYDVIEGTDAAGTRRIGVLEQSWRVGGASGAEIAAFEAFRESPDLPSVRCSTVEIYDIVTPPVGAMTKYAVRLA